MKKTLKVLLFLLGISVVAQAETVPTEMNEADKKEAMKILERMRDKIEKAEKERAKEEARLAKEKAEAEKKAQEEAERLAREQAEAERQAMEAQAQAQKAMEEAQAKVVEEQVQGAETSEVVIEATPVEEKVVIEEIKPETEEQRIERINKIIAEKRKAEKKVKPRTAFEKLEKTKEEALTKLDFYERVVRSVAREENEIKGYTEITEGK